MKQKKLFYLLMTFILLVSLVPIAKNIYSHINKKANVIELSMSGFSPNIITMKKGKEYEFQLVNLDNSAHSDGGGWHQFASDELKFNYKVAPEKTKTIKLKFNKPGKYLFYCDVCCGGKNSTAMQGKIIVK